MSENCKVCGRQLGEKYRYDECRSCRVDVNTRGAPEDCPNDGTQLIEEGVAEVGVESILKRECPECGFEQKQFLT